MNTDNLNKSQVEIMCNKINIAWNRVHDRFMNLSDSMKRIGLDYDVQYIVLDHAQKYNKTVGNVFDRIFNLRKAFDHDSDLCAYCINGIDHNLGDHKLAVERQKITNQLESFINDFDFSADCSLCLSHKIHDISEHESALKRSMGEDWFYDVYCTS